MPSDNNYLEYVLDLLSEVDDISYKKMMGEYLLKSDGILFGGDFLTIDFY
jgi:TfoX/Sxy family transcriptional regulator of competence genes